MVGAEVRAIVKRKAYRWPIHKLTILGRAKVINSSLYSRLRSWTYSMIMPENVKTALARDVERCCKVAALAVSFVSD